MAQFYMELEAHEVNEKIAYPLICTARYGSCWSTMRRKRKWVEEFTPEERKKAEELFRKAHSWFLGRGVPDKVRMTVSTYYLWKKLELFCMSI